MVAQEDKRKSHQGGAIDVDAVARMAYEEMEAWAQPLKTNTEKFDENWDGASDDDLENEGINESPVTPPLVEWKPPPEPEPEEEDEEMLPTAPRAAAGEIAACGHAKRPAATARRSCDAQDAPPAAEAIEQQPLPQPRAEEQVLLSAERP